MDISEEMSQEQLIDYADEMKLDLMTDDDKSIIIMDDKDLTTFVNLLNEDYYVSPVNGLRYEIKSKNKNRTKGVGNHQFTSSTLSLPSLHQYIQNLPHQDIQSFCLHLPSIRQYLYLLSSLLRHHNPLDKNPLLAFFRSESQL